MCYNNISQPCCIGYRAWKRGYYINPFESLVLSFFFFVPEYREYIMKEFTIKLAGLNAMTVDAVKASIGVGVGVGVVEFLGEDDSEGRPVIVFTANTNRLEYFGLTDSFSVFGSK